MTFPTTPILDTAVRANEGPPPSANWTTPAAAAGFNITSNKFAGSGVGNAAVWNPRTFGPDCEMVLQVGTLPGVGSSFSVAARCKDTGSLATIDGYTAAYTQQAGTDIVQIQRLDNGAATTLGANLSQDFTAGDSLGIRVIGSTIQAWYKSGALPWVLLGERTDTTYPLAGSLVMIGLGTTGRYSNFGGGIYAPFIPKRLLQKTYLRR